MSLSGLEFRLDTAREMLPRLVAAFAACAAREVEP